MKKILSLVLTLAMVLSLATVAWAAESNATPETWSTVLASASDGDTINLAAGTYDLGTLGSGVAKNLTIVGTEGTVVNYFGVGAVDCGNLTIKNCKFTDNSVWCFICIEGKGTFTFDNCEFIVAEGESAGSAIYMTAQYADNEYIVKNCSFTGEFNEAAVVVQNSAPGAYAVTVSDNEFDEVVGDSVGIWFKDSTVALDSDVATAAMVRTAEQFEAAAAASESGDTIKLMGDVDLTTLNTPVEITDPININDNGNTLTGLAAGFDITTNADGKITGGIFPDGVSEEYLAPGVLTATGDNGEMLVGDSINEEEEEDDEEEEDSSEPTPEEIERDRIVAAIKAAADGDTVTLDVKKLNVVSRFIADAMSGKNVNLEYTLGEKTVAVNGKNVPKTPAYRVWYSLELFSQFA